MAQQFTAFGKKQNYTTTVLGTQEISAVYLGTECSGIGEKSHNAGMVFNVHTRCSVLMTFTRQNTYIIHKART